MTAAQPGPLRKFALRAFRILPAGPSHLVIRRLAPTFSIGAVALLEHQNRILALRQLHRSGWSLPGGLVDRGEQPADALVRELAEETGLKVTAGDVFATVVDTKFRHVDLIYRVVCDHRPEVRPASEATAYDWFSLAELPDPDAPTRRIIRAVLAAHSVPEPGQLLD